MNICDKTNWCYFLVFKSSTRPTRPSREAELLYFARSTQVTKQKENTVRHLNNRFQA
jgi:hypothetical protein